MSEYILIDQIVQQDDQEDDEYSTYYIRLSVDEETQLVLGAFKPISVSVEEGFGQSVVNCRVVFEDVVGSLVNIKPVEGSFDFNLYVGRSPESTMKYKLKLRGIRSDSMQVGESGGYRFELHLTSHYWQSMSHDREFNAWRNQKYSAVVNEILDDSQLKTIHVSETAKSQRQIINPNWTRKEFFDWIRVRAEGVNGDTFFTYAATQDDGFFFSTFSDMIDGVINDSIDFETNDSRRFVLSGEGSENGDRRRLMDFRIDNNYVDELISGASGVSYGYYDFDTRAYVRGTHTFSESGERQLTDWALISEDQETVGSFYYGHRDTGGTLPIAKSTVSREVNKIHSVVTTTLGVSDVQVGELVDVLIPLSETYMDSKFNEFYSGKYVVSHKKIICSFGSSSALTSFRLTRQGINGTTVDTLIQSQAGKI